MTKEERFFYKACYFRFLRNERASWPTGMNSLDLHGKNSSKGNIFGINKGN